MYHDPEVEVLRSHLRQHNGIRDLEICEPDEIKRAARIFHRDGFVVVRDLLNVEQLRRWREGCAQVLADILSISGPEDRKYVTEPGVCLTNTAMAHVRLQDKCCPTRPGPV